MVSEGASAFFTALGVILGGALIGSIAPLLTGGLPLAAARRLANDLKLWAIAVAIGGSFPTYRVLEAGLFSGQLGTVLGHLIILLAALSGAQVGAWLVQWLASTRG